MLKNLIDDGFHPELVEQAFFAGELEIPCIERPQELIIPKGMIPFTDRNKSKAYAEFVCFYQHDIHFRDLLLSVYSYVDDLRRFPGVISPDCSLYYDMPLCLQIANTYMNRAIGYRLQQQGLYVIPNVRWGDERSYTTDVLPEKFAFLGLPKHSIVAIGTYGCSKGRLERHHLRAGLIAMLDELAPEVVLVYGSMPDAIFGDLTTRTRFINYPDWIKLRKSGGH